MSQLSLSQTDIANIMNRFPQNFELSYETISHKKVPTDYKLALAVPVGKKYFAWFSFYQNQNVLYMMELNKEKKIVKITIMDAKFNHELSLGSLLYGIFLPETNQFVIEDIHYFCGIPMKNLQFGNKMFYIHKILENFVEKGNSKNVHFSVPVLWWFSSHNDENHKIPEEMKNKIEYPVHHIQYRSLDRVLPFFNYSVQRKPFANSEQQQKQSLETIINDVKIPYANADFNKPQYRYPSVFRVKADIRFDIYHLYAYERTERKMVYYNTAYIQNVKKSYFMNSIFRKIKENTNLDYIEESDDEEDFQNIDVDKYVDLNLEIPMECEFHSKFKRWIPMRIMPKNTPIVPIDKLVFMNINASRENLSKNNTNYQKIRRGQNDNKNYHKKY
jgi:hypothetical protein